MSAAPKVSWVINVYDETTDRLAEAHPLIGVTVEQLRRIFEQPEDEPMFDSFSIGPLHVAELSRLLGKELSLKPGHHYVLECHQN